MPTIHYYTNDSRQGVLSGYDVAVQDLEQAIRELESLKTRPEVTHVAVRGTGLVAWRAPAGEWLTAQLRQGAPAHAFAW